MKLTLTDSEGVVICIWSIGAEYDYDIEDLDAEGKHDFYIEEDEPHTHRFVGERVVGEVVRARERGES